jgi:hypothetical protein
MERTPIEWDKAQFAWNTNPYGASQSSNPFTWDDVALVQEIAQLIQGGASQDDINDHLEKKKKKEQFITLWCKVQGIEVKETKKINEYKIKITDVELVIKEVLNSIKIEI